MKSFLLIVILFLGISAVESEGRKKRPCKIQLLELRALVEHWTSGVERQPVYDSLDAVERETNVLYSGVEDQWSYIRQFIDEVIAEIED